MAGSNREQKRGKRKETMGRKHIIWEWSSKKKKLNKLREVNIREKTPGGEQKRRPKINAGGTAKNASVRRSFVSSYFSIQKGLIEKGNGEYTNNRDFNREKKEWGTKGEGKRGRGCRVSRGKRKREIDQLGLSIKGGVSFFNSPTS